MAVTCPPHYWDIDMKAIDNVFFACCKKCGAHTSFPVSAELDSEDVILDELETSSEALDAFLAALK